MTVYLDTACAVNGSVNYLLLLSAACLAGAPLQRGRFLLAAALGGLYAAASFVPALAFLRTAGMKAVLLAVMALTAFGARRQTVKLALLFAAISAALAGAAMLAAQLLRLDPLLLPNGVFYPLRARAILFLAALCCGLCHLILSRVTAHSGQLIPLTIRLGPHAVPLTALLDTGNTLKDPLTGEPVLVADAGVAARNAAALADPAGLFASLSEQYPSDRFRLIPYRAVGTASGLLLAVRCNVTGKSGRSEPKLVAFSPTPVSQTGEFDALIGGCL